MWNYRGVSLGGVMLEVNSMMSGVGTVEFGGCGKGAKATVGGRVMGIAGDIQEEGRRTGVFSVVAVFS